MAAHPVDRCPAELSRAPRTRMRRPLVPRGPMTGVARAAADHPARSGFPLALTAPCRNRRQTAGLCRTPPRQHASWRRCANRTEPSRYSPAPSRVSLRAGQVPIIETSLHHVLPEMRTASSDTAWAEMDTRLAIRQAAIGKPLVGARPHLLRGLRRSGPHAIPGPHAVRTGFILRGRRASLGIWHPK